MLVQPSRDRLCGAMPLGLNGLQTALLGLAPLGNLTVYETSGRQLSAMGSNDLRRDPGA